MALSRFGLGNFMVICCPFVLFLPAAIKGGWQQRIAIRVKFEGVVVAL
jgi:hypothetical protein